MDRRIAALAAAALALGCTLASAESGVPALDIQDALRASQAALGQPIGEHILLDRASRPVALSAYRGKPLLVSFVYTGCFQVCPTATRSLDEAVSQLESRFGADRFNVVSIGFNQPADSPDALRAFAAQHRINRANWEFLSPPAAAVEPLTRAFGFRYVGTPAGFDHVLQLTLVDAEGRVARQVYGERFAAAELAEPLARMLAGQPLPPPGLLDRVADQVRLLCTVYDPATGTYRVDYSLAWEIAGGVTFIVAMAVFAFGEWRSKRRGGPGGRPAARAGV